MTREQIEAHLALHGWEAWVELTSSPRRYNLTIPQGGTIWGWEDEDTQVGVSDYYRHLTQCPKAIDFAEIPDAPFRALWNWIQEAGL